MNVAIERSRIGPEPPRRVAVLRALRLGDLLCTVPALRALRAALPGAEIVLIGLPWARAFVARFGRYLDGFREFPGYPGLAEREPQLERIPAFLAEIQGERFDLLVQLHGSGEVTNPLAVLLGARATAGFYRPGAFCPDPGRFLPYPDRGPEVQRLLELMTFLGLPSRGEELEFPIVAADREALWVRPEVRGLRPGTYACLHPGSNSLDRRWPPERFAAVAIALTARGIPVVLTGTADEAELTRAVGRAMRGPALDLTGRTDLGTLGALVEGARLLVCNDTGVAHLGAALRVPSVIISSGDHPTRWAPADRRRHRVLCRDGGVTAAEAIAQADDLLRSGPTRAA